MSKQTCNSEIFNKTQLFCFQESGWLIIFLAGGSQKINKTNSKRECIDQCKIFWVNAACIACMKPTVISTAWNVSKYEVISGPYFPVFGLNTGKYGPEITPYLDTLHAVFIDGKWKKDTCNGVFL